MSIAEDHERALLAAVLAGGRPAYEDAAGVLGRDFALPSHAAVWGAIGTLHDRGLDISALGVSDVLHQTGRLAEVGGAAAVSALEVRGLTSGSAREAGALVQEHAALRRIAEAATTIATMARERDGNSVEIMQRAQEVFFRMSRKTATAAHADRKQIVDDMVRDFESTQPRRGMPFGLRALDEGVLSHGMQPGALVVIGGRPSMGKSAFAHGVLVHCVEHYGAAALYSCEMAPAELVQREIVIEARVEKRALREAYKRGRLGTALGNAAERALYIVDSPGATLHTIAADLRRRVSTDGVVLAAIDYLQLMNHSGKRASDNASQSIGETTKGLKNLARELGIPILLLSQLSREVEKRSDKRPMMSDLRDSGSIEADADIVMFPFRPSFYWPAEKKAAASAEETATCEVIVEKHRGGPRGSAALFFTESLALFHDDWGVR
jgi:replicative DNA helicase